MLSAGITAEQFVDRPKIGPGTNDYGKSKYDLFREMIARKLSVSTKNVDIFTVLNHPVLERTVDVRFAAHGSPYYRPARLDGIVNQFKIEVSDERSLLREPSRFLSGIVSCLFVQLTQVLFR